MEDDFILFPVKCHRFFRLGAAEGGVVCRAVLGRKGVRELLHVCVCVLGHEREKEGHVEEERVGECV